MLVVALGVGLGIGRCRMAEAGIEAEVGRGMEALAEALRHGRSERLAFAVASEHFARAAGGSVLDGYPIFMLELTKAFEEQRAGQSDPRVRPIVEALARGDFAAAVSQLPDIPRDFPGREHLERAVVELARRNPDQNRRAPESE